MSVLHKAKEFNSQLITKSSIMLGLGETDEQIEQTFIGNYYILKMWIICSSLVCYLNMYFLRSKRIIS